MRPYTLDSAHDGPPRRHLAALATALVVLGAILMLMSSCGNGDLTFPGQIPPTATAVFTATSVPTVTPTP
jgi:hypothetical protein